LFKYFVANFYLHNIVMLIMRISCFLKENIDCFFYKTRLLLGCCFEKKLTLKSIDIIILISFIENNNHFIVFKNKVVGGQPGRFNS